MKHHLKSYLTRCAASSTRIIALAIAICAVGSAWADFTKTNPVTGETENYTWKFVGTDTWAGTGNWQNSSGANPSGTPAKSGDNTWDPILFDGNTININASMSVEGWNLRMGLYNGANVTMNTFVKYQGDTTMWMTVDESSQLTIGGFGGGNITANQVIKLSVAKANGITWTANLTSGNANNTFEYYLKDAGSVSYQAVSAANHKIKMADVTLTGTSQVSHKTLVSFTSSSQTFTADATIKVLNSDGDLVVSKWLGTVNTTGTTTLTTANKVGTCELVQTSTGVVLYWVDGDPAEAGYTPSININFTNGAGNGLTTSADVGLDGYAVPGTSWNNFVVANNATFNTVNAIDSTGAASVASGVSVSISGTRGHWNCSSLTPASNPLHGYIDESADGPTPTVTITGIPYEHYRVIVYHSTDQNGAQFGYDTINGFDFTYVNGVQQTGTTSWGNAGASNSAEPIAEGVNTLVSAVLTGDTVTMVAHRMSSARGCIAAIQIVEIQTLDIDEAGTYDLATKFPSISNGYVCAVNVNESATLNIGNLSGTMFFNVAPGKALTISGTGSITTPASILPSSGGMDLSESMLTIANASGTVIASDSVTIGSAGLQIPLSPALSTQTVMVKAVIPSSSSRLVGWKVNDDIEAYTSYTGSQFEQHFLNKGSVWSSTYGTSAWTRDADEHWVTVAYDRSSDTSTYLDGANKITNTSLKWSSLTTSKVTIGGTAYNTTDVATGMVIKDVQIYNQSLGSARVAKVVAALSSGWTVNAAGTTLTSAQAGSPLPGYENVQVYGTVTVAADGTLNLSGISQVLVGNGATLDVSGVSGLTYAAVTSGGVLTIGKQRPGTVVVAAGGTLAVASDPTMSERLTGYTPTATLTVSGAIAGTVTLDGETVTPVVDGSTATLTGTAVAGDPTYTGNGWWWDYEFNGNGNNIGSEGTQLSWDGDRPLQGSEYTTADETGNQMLHLPARPWRNVTAYPSEFTAVMFCKAGATANGVLVAFGSTTYGSCKTITLSTGANPSAGQMRLVYGSGQNSSTDLVEGGFTLDNITSANHLYAFTVKTVGGVSQIAVYADGDLLTTYTADSLISLGPGFQIASGHGGLPSGLSRLANDDAATMDFLRVSNVALSDVAIKALAAEYRYVSPNGIAERTLSANATWTDETNTSWSQKTLNEDGSTTTTAQAAPNSGTVVEITASTDVQLTMDLASDVSYEKLTFQGDGAITVKAGGTAPTVTTRTYINTDVTMDIAAFASLGATTIADGKTLTVVPDEASTLNAGIALGIRGETSTIVTGTVTLGEGSQVVLPSSMVSNFASYGFTLTLTPDASGRYVYTIARDDNPVHVTKAANGTITYAMYPDAVAGTPAAMALTLPAEPATIPNDFAYTVTVANNHISESFTVATDFAGGNVTVSSGTVELSGAITTSGNLTFNSATTLSGTSTISGAVSGTGTLTVSGTVTLTSTGTIANTVVGDGRIVFEQKLPASNLQTSFQDSSNWTGTVELKDYTETTDAHKIIVLTKYGNSKSTVALNGVTSTMYTGNNTYPDVTLGAIEIGEGGWSDNDGLSYTVSPLYKADLTGHGTITVKTGNAGTVRFVGNHTFDGSIAFGNSTGKQVAFMKTANDTLPSVTAGAIVVADGVNMSIASGKSWTAPSGISVLGTLKADGAAPISGSVAVSETGTLDISGFTGAAPAIPGALTLADGAALKLPSGTTLPYQIANSGTACIITGNYTIGEDAGTASGLELSEDGYLNTANMVTIATDTVLSGLEAGGKYLYKVTANATVDASGVAANVGMIQFVVDPGVRLKLSAEPACPFSISGDAFAIAGSDNRHFTATAAAEYYPSIGTLSSSGTSITIDNASSLSAGVYPLARWITPQKKSTGYGHVATLVTTGLADGLTAELVYCVDRVVLRVYDTVAQAAKGTLKIWPFGDSITEGFNAGGTRANYRVLLAQKLSMLGFNVEMVGCYDKINGADAIDPAGQVVLDAWKWHSAKHGATAGPTTSAAGRANLCENVDTLSAQAGNPDVVLLLAGANDIVPATGLTAQQVVNSITNIVAHLATNLPDSKIVVGTQINVESGYNAGNYSHVVGMIPQVNSRLKTYVDNLPAELSGKVFLADLNSYVKSGEYGILFDQSGDHLHPDWWGHDQMAEGWLSVITNKFTATQVFPSATVPAAPTTEELGAAAKSELAAYRKGFKLARRIDAVSNLNTADPYADTGNGETEGIQKVAYFVEYVRTDNHAHKWVWVDMDAFGTTIDDVGLPAANHQQVVTKLHVKSNHNGIDDVAANDDTVTGFIEFSPFDYNGNVSGVSGAPAGNASCCDWNDTLSDSGTYGCMQVHRVFSPAKSAADGVTRGGQVLFAYNNWQSSTSTAEFGIGNFSSHFYRGASDAQTLDYTYTSGATKMNADAYYIKRIEIWTKKVYGTIFSVY